MSEFKLGDVVSLKSGGPGRNVCYVDGSRVRVDWYDGKNNKMVYKTYRSEDLKKYIMPQYTIGEVANNL
ncbi:MAG: DUF2158 domain-containing protein [Chitinophagales bacterium]|nr:DUF2158 domain-containing protein [Chitinophagales bacterium]